MKIYLAGKITGEEIKVCWRKFETAAAKIRWELMCQVVHGIMINRCPVCGCLKVDSWLSCEACNYTGIRPDTWENYLKADITKMLTCDIVYLLPDWQESKGAQLERDIALRLNMDVRLYSDFIKHHSQKVL